MYVTCLNFRRVLSWFREKSAFQYLLLFVSSFDKKDEEVIQEIIKERKRIDIITGKDICFFIFAEQSFITQQDSNCSADMMIVHINEHRLLNGEKPIQKSDLRYGVGIESTVGVTGEICDCFGIKQYRLPAFILISKYNDDITLLPVQYISDVEAVLTPIRLVNAYQNDVGSQLQIIENINNTLYPEDLAIKINSIKQEINVLSLLDYTNSFLQKREDFLRYLETVSVDSASCEKISQTPKDYRKILGHAGYTTLLYADQYLREIGRQMLAEYRIYTKYNSWDKRIQSLKDKLSECEVALLKKKERSKEGDILQARSEIHTIKDYYKKKIEEEFFIEDALSILEKIDTKQSPLPDIMLLYAHRIAEKQHLIKTTLNNLKVQIAGKDFDVFISCKSEDYEAAKVLFDLLETNGHSPFLASISIREIGTDNYGDLIRQVIGLCRYMIVFTTQISYVNTPYVRTEWNLFLDELTAGRKNGKILSIIPDSHLINELPIGLRNKQVYILSDYKEYILSYLND